MATRPRTDPARRIRGWSRSDRSESRDSLASPRRGRWSSKRMRRTRPRRAEESIGSLGGYTCLLRLSSRHLLFRVRTPRASDVPRREIARLLSLESRARRLFGDARVAPSRSAWRNGTRRACGGLDARELLDELRWRHRRERRQGPPPLRRGRHLLTRPLVAHATDANETEYAPTTLHFPMPVTVDPPAG